MRSMPIKRCLLPAVLVSVSSAMIWADPTETPTPANTPQAGGDYAHALKAYQEEADRGDVAALANLARLYETGRGVSQDYGKAIELYERAAAKDYVPAQVSLAGIYASGRGVPLDYKKAVLLLEKAASKGDAHGQAGLAWAYENGLGAGRVRLSLTQARTRHHVSPR